MKAKDLFKESLNSLQFPCSKKTIIDWVALKTKGRYSNRYLKIFIEKTIVNNKDRLKLGSDIDLFLEIENELIIPFNKEYKGERYYFDKSLYKKRNKKEFEFKTNILPLKIIECRKKILIVTNCSKLKKPGILPAIEKYEGLSISILKEVSEFADIYIVSAFYGLISQDTLIDDYDQSLFDFPKQDLKKVGIIFDLRNRLNKILPLYEKVFFSMSSTYLRTIDIHKHPLDKDKNLIVFFDKNNLDTIIHNRHEFIAVEEESEDNSLNPRTKKAEKTKEMILQIVS